jgi:ubiquinone/menaquinone biosynthesis C-methylase UbiE
MADVKVTFDAAEDYERFMGRWSRAIGERFLHWLAPASGLNWLDLGCGTGAFTEMVLKLCSPQSVTSVDPALAQIEYARKQVPGVDFRVADAAALPFSDSQFDIVASGLVINFIADRPKAFSEMRRVLRPGGIAAAYLWERSATTDSSPHSPLEHGLRSIGAEVLRPPSAPESTPEGAKASLESAGFTDIATTIIETTQTYRDFEDYWRAQIMPFAPIGQSVAALTDEGRTKLRTAMRFILPPASDGTISYSARALSFRASKRA